MRAALHTGSAEISAGDYYGAAVNRTARLRAIAHGGQTVISRATWELVADSALDGIEFEDMGEHPLKDLMVGTGIGLESKGSHILKGVPEQWELYAVS